MSSWTDRAEAYARSFGTLCEGTIDRLLDDTGEGHLLDAGCGIGTLSVRAESRGRTVTAFDAESDMVEAARPRVRGRVLHAELPRVPLAGRAVDAVAANFVINHVQRPADSVAELARVTRPGGPVAMTIWPAPGPNSWAEFVGEVYREAGVVPLPRQDLDPSLDFGRSAEGLADLARGAGLHVHRAEVLEWTWSVSPDDLWAGIAGGVAGAGAAYLAQTPTIQDAVRRVFARSSASTADGTGRLMFSARAAYVLAEVPDLLPCDDGIS